MWPYWLLFAFFAVGAIVHHAPRLADGRFDTEATTRAGPLLALGSLLIAGMVGLRYEVGADWKTYVFYWQYAGYADLGRILAMSDPAYQLLNWLARQAGLGVWAVNGACGVLFAWGLVRFAGTQPLPWLVVLVAIPYLVIVVAMGYTRQAVAIGLLLAGLADLFRGGSLLRFSAYAVLAALFHRTAVLVLPLVIFSSERNRLLSVLGGLLFFYALWSALLADDVDQLVKTYITAEYNSQGAAIRVGLSLLPATLFLLGRERFAFDPLQDRFWRLSSYTAFALLVALLVVPSSTAIDRIALYIFPLQLAVLSRLPIALGDGARWLVVGYSLLIQFVWLTFAVHARYWLPYQLFPF
jgi:hypothetical protein